MINNNAIDPCPYIIDDTLTAKCTETMELLLFDLIDNFCVENREEYIRVCGSEHYY